MFAAERVLHGGRLGGSKPGTTPPRASRLLMGQTARWFGNVAASLVTLDFTRFGALMKTIFGWAPAVEGAKPNILIGAQAYTTVLGTILVVTGILSSRSRASATMTSWWRAARARSP